MYQELLGKIERRHSALFPSRGDYDSIASEVAALRAYMAGVYDAASLSPQSERDAIQGFCRNKESIWMKVHFLATGERTNMLA